MSVTELASGALVALNAGYFDTSDYAAIGLLKIDHGLLSLPSRGRAGVAFGVQGGPLIDRLDADVLITTSRGVLRVGTANGDGVSVTTTAGALAGTPSQGVLVIQDGVVEENKIGPRLVPEDGLALAYPATNRELALLDTGDRVSIDTSLRPTGFQSAAYAVEAGPLLVRDGVAAYEPSSEGFASGQRILDGLTQQAAIGVMPDGTTLLVVAETMRAQDLVRLFLELGADRAMRFDSGSSTTLVIDGKVVNRKTERKVVSAVVFIPALAGR
jgi:exopolysaccharide biosynthesis protein